MTLDDYLKKQSKAKDREAFQFMLDDPRGRWFLARLMARNFVFTSTFTGNSDTFRREGARSVILSINDEIRQMGEEAILALLKAEGEYHIWVNKQILSFGGKKNGQRNHE